MKVSDILLLLIAALWGLMTLALNAIKEANSVRDRVIKGKDEDGAFSKRHLNIMIHGDWLSMVVTLFFVSVAFAFIAWNAPAFVDQGQPPPLFPLFCRVVGAFGGLIAAWTVIGCSFDYLLMRNSLKP